MNRRSVLALLGISVSAPGGYLAWNRYRSPSFPDGVDVDTLYVRGDVFGEPSPMHRDAGPRGEYHRVIDDAGTAASEISFDESAIEFAEKTDFDVSYLVVVQTEMQTDPDLALESIARTGDGVHLAVTVEHPWWRGVDDGSGSHSLLVRITDQQEGVPESVSVDIEGYV